MACFLMIFIIILLRCSMSFVWFFQTKSHRHLIFYLECRCSPPKIFIFSTLHPLAGSSSEFPGRSLLWVGAMSSRTRCCACGAACACARSAGQTHLRYSEPLKSEGKANDKFEKSANQTETLFQTQNQIPGFSFNFFRGGG